MFDSIIRVDGARTHPSACPMSQVDTLHDMACESMQMIVEHLPTRSLSMGTDRYEFDQSGQIQWAIPKFHAMLHAASSIVLFGPWSNVEAQVVESCHVYMKRLATLTNQRKTQWQGQVLVRVSRSEESGKVWTHDGAGGAAETGGALDAAESASPSETGWTASHVTLSKSNLVAGIRFNIWDCMVGWKLCRHELRYPAQRQESRNRTGICIMLGELVTTPSSPEAMSEWIRHCSDMKELPHFLCAYIQAQYHQHLSNVPEPIDDRESFMSAREMHRDLLSLVQVLDTDSRSQCCCILDMMLT